MPLNDVRQGKNPIM